MIEFLRHANELAEKRTNVNVAKQKERVVNRRVEMSRRKLRTKGTFRHDAPVQRVVSGIETTFGTMQVSGFLG